MARKMKDKVGKYWLEEEELNPKLNKLLYIAASLDPRHKMKHVDMCLDQVYGSGRGNELITHVQSSTSELFELYKNQLTSTSTKTTTPRATSSASQSHTTSTAAQHQRLKSRGAPGSIANIPRKNVWREPNNISELTIYLGDKQYVNDIGINSRGEDDGEIDSFDILQWWTKNGARFPVLS
ncbi:hypothetical protein OROHE_006116 [Orobanche hederae]